MEARLCDTTQMERFEQSIHRFEVVLQDGWIFLAGRFDDIFDGDVMRSLRRDERFSCVHQGFLCCQAFFSFAIWLLRHIRNQLLALDRCKEDCALMRQPSLP